MNTVEYNRFKKRNIEAGVSGTACGVWGDEVYENLHVRSTRGPRDLPLAVEWRCFAHVVKTLFIHVTFQQILHVIIEYL